MEYLVVLCMLVGAVVIAYIYYWRVRRKALHTLPYVFLLISYFLMLPTGWQASSIVTLIVLSVYLFIHIAVIFDFRKR